MYYDASLLHKHGIDKSLMISPDKQSATQVCTPKLNNSKLPPGLLTIYAVEIISSSWPTQPAISDRSFEQLAAEKSFANIVYLCDRLARVT